MAPLDGGGGAWRDAEPPRDDMDLEDLDDLEVRAAELALSAADEAELLPEPGEEEEIHHQA